MSEQKTYEVLDLRRGIIGDSWTVLSDTPEHALAFLGYEGVKRNPKGKIHVSSADGFVTFSATHQNERGWMSERSEY